MKGDSKAMDSGDAEVVRRVLKVHTDDYNREMIRIRAAREEYAVTNERDRSQKHAMELAEDVADEVRFRSSQTVQRNSELRAALKKEQEKWAAGRPSVIAASRRRTSSGGPVLGRTAGSTGTAGATSPRTGTAGPTSPREAARDAPPGWAGPPPPSLVVKRAMVGRGEFPVVCEPPATGVVPLRQNLSHEERWRRKLEYRTLLDEQALAQSPRAPTPVGKSPSYGQRSHSVRSSGTQSARATPEPTSLNYTHHAWEKAEATRIRHLQRWMGTRTHPI